MKTLFSKREVNQAILLITTLVITLLIIGRLIALCYFSDYGQIGDFFNGIASPILSLFTILLIYNSYVVQREELKATKEVLKHTVQNAKLERLESITLKLLEKYEKSRDKYTIMTLPQVTELKGVDALRYIYNKIKGDNFIAIESLTLENRAHDNKGKDFLIEDLLKNYFQKLQSSHYYNDIKSLVYKFIPIYKCILNSETPSNSLDHLRFGINTHISEIEFFFIKLFINRLDDLKNLEQELLPFHIVSTSNAIFETYLKSENN